VSGRGWTACRGYRERAGKAGLKGERLDSDQERMESNQKKLDSREEMLDSEQEMLDRNQKRPEIG
jgi:hypothetical protein